MYKDSYFTLAEFCKGLSSDELLTVMSSEALLYNLNHFLLFLNVLRKEVGLPIRITSWYRDKNHNFLVGGSTSSQHLYGEAVDIYCENLEGILKALFCSSVIPLNAFGQVIYYPSRKFVHLGMVNEKWHDATLFVCFKQGMIRRFDNFEDYSGLIGHV